VATSPFIDATHFDSVRRAIDVDLTPEDLSDDVIGDDIYLTRAANQVLALDPDAESRENEAEAAIQRATIFLLAALLIPAMPQIVSEQYVDYRVKFDQLTQAERIQDLRNQAAAEIALAIGDEERGAYPRMPGFSLARGGRRAAW